MKSGAILTARVGLDKRDRLLLEFGGREARNAIDGDSPAVSAGAILRGPVEIARREERRTPGPRGAYVDLDRIARVRAPRPEELLGIPRVQLVIGRLSCCAE